MRGAEIIAAKSTELSGATIDALVRNKPMGMGLRCGNCSDGGKANNALRFDAGEIQL